jgi:hypothetical protein
VTSLECVTLETLSTETGSKEFIAVGTTIDRGEDLAVKGAVSKIILRDQTCIDRVCRPMYLSLWKLSQIHNILQSGGTNSNCVPGMIAKALSQRCVV